MVEFETNTDKDNELNTGNSTSNSNALLITTLENVGIYISYGSIIIPTMCVLWAYIYHSRILKSGPRGYDPVRLTAITKFFHNGGDFWTDCIFAFILYFEQQFNIIIPICALIFTIVPFIMSCIVAIMWIVRWRKWQDNNPIRLKNYLDKYEIHIVAWTIFAGFYAAIDLSRSKLFYKQYFNFPLRRNEYNKLEKYKFVNIVLLEVCLYV